MKFKFVLLLAGCFILPNTLFAEGVSIVVKNGDKLKLEEVSLDGGFVKGKLPIANDSEVKIPYDELNVLDFGRPESEELAEDIEYYNIYLQDGGLFKGDVLKIDGQTMKINALGIGEIELPLTAILTIAKEGLATATESMKKGHSSALLSNGSQLKGELSIKSVEDFTVKDKSLSATFKLEDVDSLQFANEGDIRTEDWKFVIYLDYGCRCYATGLEVDGKKAQVTILGDKAFTMPTAAIKKVFFISGSQIGQKKVVFLSGLGQRNSNELKNTGNALEDLKDWEVEYEYDFEFGEEFMEQLTTARAVVIPEINNNLKAEYSNWIKSQQALEENEGKEFLSLVDLAKKRLKPKLNEFLARGGNVIYLGLSGRQEESIWTLFNVNKTNSVSSEEFFFTRSGYAVSKGLGDSYRPAYSSNAYATSAQDSVFARGRYGPTLYGRKLGQGWVVINGYDNYTAGEKTDKLLLNCIKLKP